MRADLHSHSHYSDGKLSPELLVLRAAQMQIALFAITDHDCVDGLVEAFEAIEKYKLNMQLIQGVEISCLWHGFEIHILGLDIDAKNQDFVAKMHEQQKKRQTRAEKIAEKLAFLQIDNLLDKVQQLATTSISRGHFAQVLVNEGHCRNFQHAFTKYLGKGKSAYVSPEWISIDDAVVSIKAAGGIACLAHPYHYDMKSKWMRRLFSDFADAGGQASELSHPRVSPSKAKLVQEIAQQHKLYASIGSDFHAPSPWIELGRKLYIPDGFSPIWDLFAPTR